VLAVWLDGRAGTTAQLYGRLVGTDGPDRLIDDSVCERSPPALTAFPDGSVLLAYRARREGGVRDIHTARFQSDRWSAPRILSADDWRPAHGPVNGPRLASVGGNVAAVWFTAADNTARLLTAASPDAGARFTLPQPVDLGRPLGRADLVLLRDGSRLVTWLEGGEVPGLYLRRISASDEPDLAVRLAPTADGFPRIALVKDYDATPAQLLLTYTTAGESPALHTTLLTLPDLSTLAGRKPCLPCDEEDANAVRGYPMKGLVTDVQPDRGLVIVKHDEIPGVMRAMTMAFKVDAALLPQLTRDQALLGRIEKRGRDWWLFNVKLLGAPPAAQN
jgi:hypothetical protein